MTRVLLLSLSMLSTTYISSQQTTPALHYEIVSIHEGQPNPNGSWVVRGGNRNPHEARLEITNWTLQSLLSVAFGLRYDHVEGVPDALQRSMYVIHAQSGDETAVALKALPDDEAKKAQLTMMQEILTERFHLRYHIDTREAPTFLLVPGKQLKLKASSVKPLVPGDERHFNPSDPTQPSMSEHCERRGCVLTARGQTMEWLTEMVGGQLPGPLIDRTDLSGVWDFNLQWSGSNDTSTGEGDYPPIEAAVADQLGLKIERGKAPQQFLVVEHIEPPTPN